MTRRFFTLHSRHTSVGINIEAPAERRVEDVFVEALASRGLMPYDVYSFMSIDSEKLAETHGLEGPALEDWQEHIFDLRGLPAISPDARMLLASIFYRENTVLEISETGSQLSPRALAAVQELIDVRLLRDGPGRTGGTRYGLTAKGREFPRQMPLAVLQGSRSFPILAPKTEDPAAVLAPA